MFLWHTRVGVATSESRTSRGLPRSILTFLLSSDCDSEYELHEVSTPHAVLRVAREGNTTGPVIITFHDIGLNHLTNFKVRMISLSLLFLMIHFATWVEF